MDQTSTIHSVDTGFGYSCSFKVVIFQAMQNIVFLIHHARNGQPVRDQQPHSLLCYGEEPHHTHGCTWTSPHLSLTQTRTFAQLD